MSLSHPLPDYPNVVGPMVGAALMPVTVMRPLFSSKVLAGFPSPAEAYVEKGLDLNQFLIRNPATTFFFWVRGPSMKDAGIDDGDLIAVDRSINPQPGHIVLAVVNNEYTVKRFTVNKGIIELRAENRAYPNILFGDTDELIIWGVVVAAVAKILA